MLTKMSSEDEFDYMSDNFLAEWLVLYDTYSYFLCICDNF
jgi:hypothetical protein